MISSLERLNQEMNDGVEDLSDLEITAPTTRVEDLPTDEAWDTSPEGSCAYIRLHRMKVFHTIQSLLLEQKGNGL